MEAFNGNIEYHGKKPEEVIEKAYAFFSGKLESVLQERGDAGVEYLREQVEGLAEEAKDRFGVDMSVDNILNVVLEGIMARNEPLPEKLEEYYLSGFSDSVLGKIQDDDPDDILDEEFEKLRDKGIFLDENKVRADIIERYWSMVSEEYADKDKVEPENEYGLN